MSNAADDVQVTSFIAPEALERHIKKLHPGMVITRGQYESIVPGLVSDLEWGFYDELHRIHLHGTYNDVFKVFTGKYFSVNVVRWKNLPIFIQVANAKIAHGLFYQAFTVLGVIYCHQWTRMEQRDDLTTLLDRTWFTASHWLFKPLQTLFNWQLMKLQIQQDDEDTTEIRGRRRDLRRKGFTFKTDEPDFVNSNVLEDHIRFPVNAPEARVSLKEFADGTVHDVCAGTLELLVKKQRDEVLVWPGICPHEGARLQQKHMRDGIVQCPWHGRKFTCSRLRSTKRDTWTFLDFEIVLEKDDLVVKRR